MKQMKIVFALLVGACSAQAYTETSPAVYTEKAAYQNNWQMREARKIGVGTHVGGTAGMMGAHLDLNLDGEDGALVGLGFGEGFNTYTLAWKRNYVGSYFTPYTTLGWSRWAVSGSRTPDSYMLESTVSERKLRSGDFNVDYVVGSVGAQYHQLDGEFMGASLFAEVGLLASPGEGRMAPAASVGATYFF